MDIAKLANEKIQIDVITLGYCTVDMWRACIERLQESRSDETTWNHTFIYHYYPVDMENNKSGLKAIADQYGLKWAYPEKNLGLQEGMNWGHKNIYPDSDYILYFDPDTTCLQKGWDLELLKVIKDPEIGWAALKCAIADKEFAAVPNYQKNINGVGCTIVEAPIMVECGIVKMSWVKLVGGFKEPVAYYGGLEAEMFRDLTARGFKLAILNNYYTDQSLKADYEDKKFRAWKFRHSSDRFKGNFDEYLAQGGTEEIYD